MNVSMYLYIHASMCSDSQGGAPDVRLRAGTLYVADWRAPAALGRDGG